MIQVSQNDFGFVPSSSYSIALRTCIVFQFCVGQMWIDAASFHVLRDLLSGAKNNNTQIIVEFEKITGMQHQIRQDWSPECYLMLFFAERWPNLKEWSKKCKYWRPWLSNGIIAKLCRKFLASFLKMMIIIEFLQYLVKSIWDKNFNIFFSIQGT